MSSLNTKLYALRKRIDVKVAGADELRGLWDRLEAYALIPPFGLSIRMLQAFCDNTPDQEELLAQFRICSADQRHRTDVDILFVFTIIGLQVPYHDWTEGELRTIMHRLFDTFGLLSARYANAITANRAQAEEDEGTLAHKLYITLPRSEKRVFVNRHLRGSYPADMR